MPALPKLKRLSLADTELKDLPASLATTLKCLTSLSIPSSAWATIPEAVALIPTLSRLTLNGNNIKLRHKDVRTLMAMPALKHLLLVHNGSWSARNASVLMSIREKLPGLVVQLKDGHSDDSDVDDVPDDE